MDPSFDLAVQHIFYKIWPWDANSCPFIIVVTNTLLEEQQGTLNESKGWKLPTMNVKKPGQMRWKSNSAFPLLCSQFWRISPENGVADSLAGIDGKVIQV